MKTTQGVVTSIALLFLFATLAQAQNTLQFTSASATPERAIRLSWASNTNEVYEIDCTDTLIDTNTGVTPWQTLYTDYPSHGTNTFWLDTGDYVHTPNITHPKNSSVRFYRVVMTGTNTGINPTIAISSPTNGAVVSGDLAITVSASSDASQPVLETILYVDGEEMPLSDDGSNYVINTCEWWNGQHTLFAVAKSQSGLEGLPGFNDSLTFGRAVSPYVTVTFSNLISELTFSQPFFEPSLGQTQQVTANFSASCDWTLQIEDVASNVVRTSTGSGSSMEFDWDGTDDGGTNVPNGVYHYFLSAETNGDAFSMSGSSSSLLSGLDETNELWEVPSEGQPIPLRLYPATMETNGMNLIVASPSEIQSVYALTDEVSDSGAFSPDDAGSPASQDTEGPKRPPTKPVAGAVGTIGIGYQQYGTAQFTAPPPTGWPYPVQPQFVTVEGETNNQVYFSPLYNAKSVADQFSQMMDIAGWKTVFNKGDISATDVKKSGLGGSSIFNTVNMGLLIGHGIFGSTAEKDSVKYTYHVFKNGPVLEYTRFSDMDLGSAGTNGLRWMTFFSCSMLKQANFNSMKNAGFLPINDNLHLVLGSDTDMEMNPNLARNYALNMIQATPTTIHDAWIDAGTRVYTNAPKPSFAIKFAIAGWPDCFNDTVNSYFVPDTGDDIQYQSVTVFTP